MTTKENNESLNGKKPCPFCGSSDLTMTLWADDNGEYDAIECNKCLGAAPYHIWDDRTDT